MSKRTLFSALLLGLFVTLPAFAADKKTPAKPAADPSGNWSWSITTPNGDTFTPTAKLKVDGETLTGTVSGRRGGDTDISEGKFKAGEISFTVVRERNGNKMISKYHGTLSGDSIKGTIEFERDGEAQKRDWDAKREGATPPPAVAAAPAPAPAPPAKPPAPAKPAPKK